MGRLGAGLERTVLGMWGTLGVILFDFFLDAGDDLVRVFEIGQ